MLVALYCAAAFPVPAIGAEDPAAEPPAEFDLLHAIKTMRTIEAEQGDVARDLIEPLTALGNHYAATDRCPDAIPVLNRALEISRRIDSLYNRAQLELYKPLLECYLALELTADVDRTLQHAIRIDEAAYGKNDPQMLPILDRAGRWYEQAGEYQSARDLYGRGIKIARTAGGDKDPRQIDPLRGIARTCRLEHQFQTTDRALNALGERSLERAAEIVRSHPDGDPDQRLDTLLDLADWYQMTDLPRDALKIYKEIWQLDRDRFLNPTPILYRAQGGSALRRPPPDRSQYRHFIVDLTYTVTREGRVTDVFIAEANNTPRDAQYRLIDSLKQTHYRPRFENGEPVETPGMTLRQGVYVAN